MTQPPPQGPDHGADGSDRPTQSFGYPEGEQPTQSFPPQGGVAPHGGHSPHAAPHGGYAQTGAHPPQGGQPQQGGFPQQGQAAPGGGYGQQPGAGPYGAPDQYGGGYGQAAGGGQYGAPGQYGAGQYGPGQYGDGGQYGGPGGHPGQQEPKRRSPVLIVVAVLVAALVVGGLIFAGVQIFGDDDDPVAGPQTEEQTEDATEGETDAGAADPEQPDADQNGSEADDTTSEPEGDGTAEDQQEELSGELYDYLQGFVQGVEGQVSSWTIDAPGWQAHHELDPTPAEAYIATFTSADDDSVTMWAARLDDPQAAVDWGQALVDDRGEADESGPVWQIEEEVDDDLEYGEFHMWRDGGDIEVIWWDETGVVRHVSGPADQAWDFYLHVSI